jgi:hypothetical protein
VKQSNKNKTMATLDYKLSADTLNRVGRAKSSGYAASGIGDTSGLEDTLETIVEEGKKEKEEDKIKEQKAGLAGLSMEQGFNEQAERGSWGDTPKLYEQMQVYMQTDKKAYLAALNDEDPVGAQRILQDQNKKSVEMNKWSSLMKTAGEIHNETGWGALITDDEVASYKLGELTSMANGKMLFDSPENGGKMYIEIPGQNEGDEPIKVYRNDIDQLVAQGIKPKERQAAFLNSTIAIKEQGLNGTVWDESTQSVIMTNNKNMIDKKNAYSVAMDDWTGGTKFIEDIDSWDAGNIERLDDNDESNGNAKQDALRKVKELVTQAKQGAITNEDFDVLQDIMARWMMGKQKTNFDDGARQRLTTQVDKMRGMGGQTNIAEANRLEGLLQT